jgi:MarR family 2-MHQ and catechol resistance regulon transcriptional repressor
LSAVATKTSVPRPLKIENAEDPALRAWVVLARAYHTIVRAVSRDASGYGLTLGQFAVLEALYHKGPLPLGKIGSLLLVTAGNITYVVDQLEKRGYVKRERSNSDRRVVSASLTPSGRALLGEIFPKHARFVADLFDKLDPDELAQLRRVLKKLGKSNA